MPDRKSASLLLSSVAHKCSGNFGRNPEVVASISFHGRSDTHCWLLGEGIASVVEARNWLDSRLLHRSNCLQPRGLPSSDCGRESTKLGG